MSNFKKLIPCLVFLTAPFYEACMIKTFVKDNQFNSQSEVHIHEGGHHTEKSMSFGESYPTVIEKPQDPKPKLKRKRKRRRKSVRRPPKRRISKRPSRRFVKKLKYKKQSVCRGKIKKKCKRRKKDKK